MRVPRLAGEITVRAGAATAPAGRAPDPDPADVARLVERRLAAGAQAPAVVGAEAVARLVSRRQDAEGVAPVELPPEPLEGADDVFRLASRRQAVDPLDTSSPYAAEVARLAARRSDPAHDGPSPSASVDAVTRLMERRRDGGSTAAPLVERRHDQTAPPSETEE